MYLMMNLMTKLMMSPMTKLMMSPMMIPMMKLNLKNPKKLFPRDRSLKQTLLIKIIVRNHKKDRVKLLQKN